MLRFTIKILLSFFDAFATGTCIDIVYMKEQTDILKKRDK